MHDVSAVRFPGVQPQRSPTGLSGRLGSRSHPRLRVQRGVDGLRLLGEVGGGPWGVTPAFPFPLNVRQVPAPAGTVAHPIPFSAYQCPCAPVPGTPLFEFEVAESVDSHIPPLAVVSACCCCRPPLYPPYSSGSVPRETTRCSVGYVASYQGPRRYCAREGERHHRVRVIEMIHLLEFLFTPLFPRTPVMSLPVCSSNWRCKWFAPRPPVCKRFRRFAPQAPTRTRYPAMPAHTRGLTILDPHTLPSPCFFPRKAVDGRGGL